LIDDSDEELQNPTISEDGINSPPTSSPVPSKSPSPIPLPSVSVFVDCIVNGKPVNRSKQSVQAMEVPWFTFRNNILSLCASKLPPNRRIFQIGTDSDIVWAWCTQSKAYSKTVQIPYSELEMEEDFAAVQQAVRASKKPGEMILKLLVTITTEKEDEDIPESSERPNLRAVQAHIYIIDL
jgi:hypothetical protein